MKATKILFLTISAALSILVTSCGTDVVDNPVIPAPKEFAQFGFVHAALDVNPVDISLDGVKKTTTPVAYGAVSPYFETELKSGVATKIEVSIGATVALSESLNINAATLAKSQNIGFLAIAYLDSTTARTPKLLTFSNDLKAPSGVNAKVNVVHLVPDAARTKLDVRYVAPGAVANATSPSIATGVEFAKKTEFFELPQGKYDLKFLQNGTTNLFVSLANTASEKGEGFDVKAGEIYTIIMRGTSAGANEKNVKLTYFKHK